MYFEVLDLVTAEISRCFDQSDLTIAADRERLLVESANGSHCPIPPNIREMYKGDVDMTRLSVHLRMLPDIIKRHGEMAGVPVRRVTNTRTICDAMKVLWPRLCVWNYIAYFNFPYSSSHNIEI